VQKTDIYIYWFLNKIFQIKGVAMKKFIGVNGIRMCYEDVGERKLYRKLTSEIKGIYMIASNISQKDGQLYFAGQKVKDLAKKYQTPLYLLDEERIRENCRHYTRIFKKHFPKGSRALYASKANSLKALYKIMENEEMGIDVVSLGEIYTAKMAGYGLEKAYFHGSCKTDAEIAFAIDENIGCFVADSEEELKAINNIAKEKNKIQKILLRLTPGIDPHTYEAVATGKVDSKFGSPIETGQALQMVALALSLPNIHLAGFHCHVGSQVFFEDVYERACIVMLNFIREVRDKFNFEIEELNLGGGFGVRYVEKDSIPNIEERLLKISQVFYENCEALEIKKPIFLMEPGRSIVADAGMTLYTVGSIKKILGYKNYVIIDGGMGDNPRYALYGSSYTCLAAEKLLEENSMNADLAGRCCESGDIIQPNVNFPDSLKRGDLIAVCITGAYNYSMASNYNKLPRPAMVLLNKGENRLIVERESLEDLCKNELL